MARVQMREWRHVLEIKTPESQQQRAAIQQEATTTAGSDTQQQGGETEQGTIARQK
jgi:hypothetical protein